MKRSTLLVVGVIIALIVVVALVFILRGNTSSAQTVTLPDLNQRRIRVAVENAYAPFNGFDATTGEPIGWDYDAVRELCARLNCIPEFVPAEWDGMLTGIARGEWDMLGDGVSITDERRETMAFSEPYHTINQVLVTRRNETRFSNAPTLAELSLNSAVTVGAQESTTNFDVAAELVGLANVTAFESGTSAMVDALLGGTIDAIVADDAYADALIDQYPSELQIAGAPILSDNLGFVFPIGSQLIDPVNQALAAMRADGTLQRLADTWFNVSTSRFAAP